MAELEDLKKAASYKCKCGKECILPGSTPCPDAQKKIEDLLKAIEDGALNPPKEVKPLTVGVPTRQVSPMYGWVCSGCGSGYAPHVQKCSSCGPSYSFTTGTGGILDPIIGPGRFGSK